MPLQLKHISLLFLLLCLGFSGISQNIQFTPEEQAWIDAHPTIEFGYESNWEPYEIYKNGTYTGIVGDYISKIESATGIEMVPVENITWEESINRLKKGTLHVIPSCAITPERKDYLEFSEVYITDPLIIATKRDYEFVGNLKELQNKTVVVPKKYYTAEIIKKEFPKINLIYANTVKECLEMVTFGKADAFVGSLGVVSYYINHKGFTNLKIAAPTKYDDIQIAFAVTKDWIIFRDIVQKVLNQISFKERSDIRKNWISVRYEYGFSMKRALRIFIIFLLVVTIGYFIFFIWNRSLRKQIKLKQKAQDELQYSLKEIQQQDQEKKVLLQEIHHRVKNNLQVIISLLRLQINTNDDPKVVQSLNDAIDRIQAISLIHENVYQTGNLGSISTAEYIQSLAYQIIDNLTDTPIDIHIDTGKVNLDLKESLPIALIINELITNSIKHGLAGRNNGKIEIQMRKKENEIEMKYSDNGEWKKPKEKSSLGTILIDSFTEQMEGKYDIEKNRNGTVFHFQFKNTRTV